MVMVGLDIIKTLIVSILLVIVQMVGIKIDVIQLLQPLIIALEAIKATCVLHMRGILQDLTLVEQEIYNVLFMISINMGLEEVIEVNNEIDND